jgi:hypothetical protein
MFGAFMPVFSVLSVEVLKGVISYVTDEGFRVGGAVHEEFVCKVVDELADYVFVYFQLFDTQIIETRDLQELRMLEVRNPIPRQCRIH